MLSNIIKQNKTRTEKKGFFAFLKNVPVRFDYIFNIIAIQ